jgi:hypothetical protein
MKLLVDANPKKKTERCGIGARSPRSIKNDMKDKKKQTGDELRPEYDFDYSKAVRGKYFQRLIAEGSNVVILEPDVAKAFRDSMSVNEALR